jgi:hypothetical protein
MATYDARPSAFTQLTTTSDWESFVSSAGIWDGIDGNGFVPSLDAPGRNAVMGGGQCLIRGQLWRADAAVPTPVPAASAQNRLDRLVIQLNRGATSSPTVVQPVVITGTPSGSPALPPLSQTFGGIWQIPVSYWTSTSAGALSSLIDQRQYSGRTVISMTSTYHPTPLNPCIGIEIDTGDVFYWNGSVWTSSGPVTQVVQGGTSQNTTSVGAMHAWFPIPTNDAQISTVAYRLHCGGHGTQAAGTAQAINYQLYAFGQAWGGSTDNGGVIAGGAFHWDYSHELIVSPNGAASAHGVMVISQSTASIQGHATASDLQVPASTLNIQMTGNQMALQAGWASITGAPVLVCTGATYERFTN